MKRAIGILSVSLLILLNMFGFNMMILPAIAVKQMMATLHATGSQIGLLGSVIYYPIFFLSLFIGPLIDKVPSKYVGAVSSFLIAAGALLLSLATVYSTAMTGTIIFGVGISTGMVLMFYAIKQWLSPRWYALYICSAMALSNLSMTVMSLVFNDLLKTAAWQQLFAWMAWFGFALAIVIFFFVSNNKDYHDDIDDSALFWPSVVTLLKNTEFWKILVIACFLYLPMAAFANFWSISFFKDVYHYSATATAHVYSVLLGGITAGTFLFGLLSDLLEHRRLQLTVSLVLCAILISCATYLSGLSYTEVVTLMIILGVVMGSNTLPFYFAARVAPANTLATALSLATMASYFGNVAFISIIGKILDLYWTGQMLDGARLFTRHGFEVAFSTFPVAYFLAFAFAFFLKPLPKFHMPHHKKH